MRLSRKAIKIFDTCHRMSASNARVGSSFLFFFLKNASSQNRILISFVLCAKIIYIFSAFFSSVSTLFPLRSTLWCIFFSVSATRLLHYGQNFVYNKRNLFNKKSYYDMILYDKKSILISKYNGSVRRQSILQKAIKLIR